jgi:chromosome partitioning protein
MQPTTGLVADHTRVRPPVSARTSYREFARLRDTAEVVLEQARQRMQEPHPRKRPPTFTTSEVASMLGTTRRKIHYEISKNEGLPRGEQVAASSRRTFTLKEAREWVRRLGENRPRPPGKSGKVIAVTNFKGGSSKTTTSFHLAQALSLRHGRKVLLVDLDSQASATVLCDFLPEKEVRAEHTILPFFEGGEEGPPDLRYAVRETYWDGLYIIPATFEIYSSEVTIPIDTALDPRFEFWGILKQGLEPLLSEFDVVIIDCPPSLSYLTFNAVFAADGLVLPTPPESLDFASSAMYWQLLVDLFGVVEERCRAAGKPFDKDFDFINVLISKVNPRSPAAPIVRQWILDAYGAKVLPIEVPLSDMASAKASEFGSVYDMSRDDADPRSVARIRDAANAIAREIDQQMVLRWYEDEVAP